MIKIGDFGLFNDSLCYCIGFEEACAVMREANRYFTIDFDDVEFIFLNTVKVEKGEMEAYTKYKEKEAEELEAFNSLLDEIEKFF